MRAAGLRGVSRRRFVRTTTADIHALLPPDLVDRNFRIAELDRLWVADITYIATWTGFLYLAIVLDACSRKVVGWAMEHHLRTELVLAAINMALAQRRPQEVIHHSDRGCQPGLNWSSQRSLRSYILLQKSSKQRSLTRMRQKTTISMQSGRLFEPVCARSR